MNRPIKFRAWHREKKRWLDSVRVYDDGSWSGSVVEERGEIDGYDESECELMQFTGLLDKSGKEIYEGDVVTKRNRPDLHCLVYFDDRDFSYRLAIRGDKQFDKTLPLMFADKVIGNVYQHPNLLTEVKP